MTDYGLTQDYQAYTSEDHQVWNILYDRQMQVLPGRAAEAYFEGIEKIYFQPDQVPNFEETNTLLTSITGWSIAVVPGLIDNKPFFEFLSNKKFPATTWLRKMEQLDYLEEPDMFHDVFGHVPLLTNPHFCEFLTGLSDIALEHIDNEYAIELISRLYWYTVEFGLIENKDGLKIYGAGILSSSGESVYALESNIPRRLPYNVKEILSSPYIKDKFQAQYWVIRSYEQLFDSIATVKKELPSLLTLANS